MIYAPDAVAHMLSGKAVARAVRGQFLVDSVLNALIASSAFDISLPSEETDPATTVTGNTRENCSSQGEKMEGDNTGSKNFNSDEMKNNFNDSGISCCLQLFDEIVKKEVSAEVLALSQELDSIEAKFS